jgi:hypothetical protein
MKIRPSIILFIGIVAVLIVLLLWGKKPVEPSLAVSAETNVEQSATTAPSSPGSAMVITNAAPGKYVSKANLSPSINQPKADNPREGLAALNDVPIVFYGRLEDQFGNPVVGASINGTTVIYNGTSSGAERVSTISDANGFFQLNAGKGESLGIMPYKDGYVLATKGTSFKYSYMYADHFTPDQNNPTVIKMWKLQGAEHLIHFQSEIRVPIDGSPVQLDLQTGKQVTSGGDIVIQVESVSNPNVVQEYDWQVKIEAINGGLISSGDSFDQMFQAPETNYSPEFNITYQKKGATWSTTFIGSFYFTSRNSGCYGKLGIEFLSDVVKNGTIPVILNSYINPNSSRNLEINQ